jgi:thioredoxin 1
MLGPKIDEMATKGEIVVQKVNVDTDEELTKRFGVRAVPTLVLVNDSLEELTRIVGVKPLQDIKDIWNEHNNGATEHSPN